jgi:hypothetical protein
MTIERRRQKDMKIEIKSESDLRAILEKYGVRYDAWGTGGAQGRKTIVDLMKEVIDGDSELFVRGNELVRKLRVLGFLVTYTDPDKGPLVLREQHQFFHATNERRVRTKWASVSEKLKTTEEPDIESIARTLLEELHLSGDPATIDPMGIDPKGEIIEKTDPSFGGLSTEYPMHKYHIELSPLQYVPEGYCEAQEKKTTCFHWVPVERGVTITTHTEQSEVKKTTSEFSDIEFDASGFPQKFVALEDNLGNTYVVSYPTTKECTLHVHILTKGAPKFRSQGKNVTQAGGGVLRKVGNILYIGGTSTQLKDFNKQKVKERLQKDYPNHEIIEE